MHGILEYWSLFLCVILGYQSPLFMLSYDTGI